MKKSLVSATHPRVTAVTTIYSFCWVGSLLPRLLRLFFGNICGNQLVLRYIFQSHDMRMIGLFVESKLRDNVSKKQQNQLREVSVHYDVLSQASYHYWLEHHFFWRNYPPQSLHSPLKIGLLLVSQSPFFWGSSFLGVMSFVSGRQALHDFRVQRLHLHREPKEIIDDQNKSKDLRWPAGKMGPPPVINAAS